MLIRIDTMERVTKESGFHHGYKMLVIKNRHTGMIENVRSKHNYYLKDRNKEQRELKIKWSEGDYICLSVTLN
jgi:hypothetical protein